MRSWLAPPHREASESASYSFQADFCGPSGADEFAYDLIRMSKRSFIGSLVAGLRAKGLGETLTGLCSARVPRGRCTARAGDRLDSR